MLVACVEVEQKFQYLVAHFVESCVGFVNLVDDDDDFKSERQRFFDDETRLRHRTFLRVDEKHDAVDHLQHTLDFARKICVSRGVDDVDFDAVVVD